MAMTCPASQMGNFVITPAKNEQYQDLLLS